MYAREVSMHLKAKAGREFTRVIEKDILPRLRKQTGFADELTLLLPAQLISPRKPPGLEGLMGGGS